LIRCVHFVPRVGRAAIFRRIAERRMWSSRCWRRFVGGAVWGARGKNSAKSWFHSLVPHSPHPWRRNSWGWPDHEMVVVFWLRCYASDACLNLAERLHFLMERLHAWVGWIGDVFIGNVVRREMLTCFLDLYTCIPHVIGLIILWFWFHLRHFTSVFLSASNCWSTMRTVKAPEMVKRTC
jgi:hypothetical protein